MLMRDLLWRGLAAGFAAGLVTLVFAWTVGEPQIDRAIAFEALTAESEAHTHTDATTADAGHSHGEEEEIVSRSTQKTWGLATALLVIGTAFGGILALAFAFAYGRIGP